MPVLSRFQSGGSGANGVPLSAVTGIVAQPVSGKVYIKWTDPEDVTYDEATLATWAGTLLVRKAGSGPIGRKDGVQVLDSKTRDAYKNIWFVDSGLSNGTTYHYKFFPYTTDGVFTDNAADQFSATPVATAPGNVSGITLTAAGNGKLGIKWTDPAATITTNGVVVSTWASTKVVVKAGSYATSPNDANAVFTYTETTRNAYSSTALVATGLTNGTTYYVSFFPTSTDGAINTSTANRKSGIANRITITTVPSQNGTLTYNGNARTPSWNNYDSTKMTLNVTSQTNAGTYDATFTPKTDYRWSDGSTDAKIVEWSIGKADGTISASKASVELNSDALNSTVTLSGNYDGTIVVGTSDASVAMVSISGNTVTISSVNDTTGTATITVSVQSGTNQNYTIPASIEISVTAQFKPVAYTSAQSGITYTDGVSGLSATELSEIAEAISNNSSITNTTSEVWVNVYDRHISIGDQLTCVFNGNDDCFIVMGFNHYETVDDNNAVNGIAGILFQMEDCDSTSKKMSNYTTISQGWHNSTMRTYLNGTMIGYLPSDIQGIIKTVDIKTATSASSSTIRHTYDKIFLPSEVEVFGEATYATGGTNEGTQYGWYSAGNTKVKKTYNYYWDNGVWWTRSPLNYDGNAYFVVVSATGSANRTISTNTRGVSPCFCI